MSKNCCDYGCNQGDGCPARVTPAKPKGSATAAFFLVVALALLAAWAMSSVRG